MTKGISAVIATIMLLMISVSLISVFYVFSSTLTSSATSSGGEQVSQLTKQLSTCMQIDGVNANDNKVYLRNCGKGVIESKALQVFLDDLKISYNLSSVINEGESGELSFYLKSCNEIKKYSGFHTFKITGSTGGLALLSKDIETKSGVYSIDPDGTGSTQPFQVYCDMETDGGGWTLVMKTGDGTGHSWSTADQGSSNLLSLTLPDSNIHYKFSDAVMNQIKDATLKSSDAIAIRMIESQSYNVKRFGKTACTLCTSYADACDYDCVYITDTYSTTPSYSNLADGDNWKFFLGAANTGATYGWQRMSIYGRANYAFHYGWVGSSYGGTMWVK